MEHTPRKRFGQNFLQDPNIIHKIVRHIDPKKEDHLVEIGPGKAALTQCLLPLAGKLDVVEIDRDLIPALKELNGLHVHEADALEFNFASLASADKKIRVVGNLPYNISTPLLFHLFKQIDAIQDMYFMLQKEVVDRLAAKPGNKVYGRLSVMAQYYCQVEKLFVVKPGAFYPIPKVDSAIVRLIPQQNTLKATSLETLTSLVAQAFQQRRKTLRNTLKGLISGEKLEELNIDPHIRPEQLTVLDYIHIANAISPTGKK